MKNCLKFLLMLTLASCNLNQQEKENLVTLKLKAKADMQQKVNRVIRQLRDDCDSTILQMASQKVDSIRASRKKIKGSKTPHRAHGVEY